MLRFCRSRCQVYLIRDNRYYVTSLAAAEYRAGRSRLNSDSLFQWLLHWIFNNSIFTAFIVPLYVQMKWQNALKSRQLRIFSDIAIQTLTVSAVILSQYSPQYWIPERIQPQNTACFQQNQASSLAKFRIPVILLYCFAFKNRIPPEYRFFAPLVKHLIHFWIQSQYRGGLSESEAASEIPAVTCLLPRNRFLSVNPIVMIQHQRKQCFHANSVLKN